MSSQQSLKRTANDLLECYPNKRVTILRTGQHPLGIKPWGNYYDQSASCSASADYRTTSLGKLACFTDEILLEVLGYLNPKCLLVLCATSRVLYCFASFEELWKQHTIEKYNGDWQWHDTWRLTFLKRSCPSYVTSAPAIRLDNFYSDTLFQPFLCASTSMDAFIGRETIDRRSNLSLDEFANEYAKQNKPVILTDVVAKWPAFGKWSTRYLVERYGDVVFRAEAIDIKLKDYVRYSANTMDESPLYLFDKEFVEKCPGIENDYEVPGYFCEDFFQIFGKNRPDYRWLIIGPARSGSTFHKDPNSTSAWNAVITGSKKWIMYPPDVLPPGIFTSDDEAEVTSPVSLMEWYLNYYRKTLRTESRPLEGVCRTGEIIFVPNGWWHMVVNLEDSIAITQNFVGSHNLLNVLAFLRDKPAQISGCSFPFAGSIFSEFLQLLQSSYPGMLERLKRDYDDQKKDDKIPKAKEKVVSGVWKRLKEGKDGGIKFSFRFDFHDCEEDAGEIESFADE